MLERRVTLVCGPPCAGKTTYVAQHAQPDDLVLDQDRLGQAEMARGVDRVSRMEEGRAWVIRCCPGPDNRAALAATLRADDIVLLRPDNEVLFKRARSRRKAGVAVLAVRNWIRQEAGDGAPSSRQGGRDPRPRKGTRW